ncbi:hypothetical protein CEXT_330811 [Caerostris extrusa]|uniref:Uncharacterized protein n=1 Tax=Caerostris extrusa TaxID=172846 RepID=A0AAV4WT92_CAEEX|nr:hypothetical protein CEXT_330811 [Caerostris extrusa]
MTTLWLSNTSTRNHKRPHKNLPDVSPLDVVGGAAFLTFLFLSVCLQISRGGLLDLSAPPHRRAVRGPLYFVSDAHKGRSVPQRFKLIGLKSHASVEMSHFCV